MTAVITNARRRRVDSTVFVQILNAYSARNPSALISDSEYYECLEQLANIEEQNCNTKVQRGPSVLRQKCTLQDRFGTKLIVEHKREGNVLVAPSQTRNLELVPFSRVYTALEELTAIYTNQCELQRAVKDTVLGIPEEIVQEYCDMVSSCPVSIDDLQEEREANKLKKCSVCNAEKSVEEFLKDDKEPSGLRDRCMDCDRRTRHKKKVKIYPGEEEFILEYNNTNNNTNNNRNKTQSATPLGFSGTAICAACGMRKSADEYDKEKSKPLAISCQRELMLDRFYRDSYTKAGFRPRCMECMRARKSNSQTVEKKTSIQVQPLPPVQANHQIMKHEIDEEKISVTVETDESPIVPTHQRSRRKGKASCQEESIMIDKTWSPKMDCIKEVEICTKFRQRSKTARFLEFSENKAAVSLSAVSARIRTQKQKQNTTPPVLKNRRRLKGTREKSKHLSGTTVRDEYGNLTKYCTGCLQFKLTDEFGRDCSKASGLRSRCRSCQRRRTRPNTLQSVTTNNINDAPIALRKTPRKPTPKRKTGLKICTKCELEKSTTEFYRDRNQSSGISASCKKCSNAVKNKQQEKTLTLPTRSGRQKQWSRSQGEEENLDKVLDYIDALLPESSGESAGIGEFLEDDKIEISSTPGCENHRICVSCKVDKNWIEFNLNPMLPSGLCPVCKDCLRGNGMSGRRVRKQRPKRRNCVRCKQPRSSIHFAKSLLLPNRITLVCNKCRSQEANNKLQDQSSDSRIHLDNCKKHDMSMRDRRSNDGLRKALDVMDYECDALRVCDPVGPEHLWRDLKSESDLEECRKKRRKLRHSTSKKDGLLSTKLCLEMNGVTMTHHISAENWIKSNTCQNTETPFFRDEKKRGKPLILEKQCKLCGEIKAAEKFTPDSSKTCRLSPQCNECHNRGLQFHA
eukprot:g1133.t1